MKTSWNLRVFLIAVVLVQFGFPITLYGRLWTSVYILMQVAMVVFGVLTVRSEGERVAPVFVPGVVALAFGGWFSLDPDSSARTLGVNLAVGLFMLALVLYLLRFIASRVTALLTLERSPAIGHRKANAFCVHGMVSSHHGRRADPGYRGHHGGRL